LNEPCRLIPRAALKEALYGGIFLLPKEVWLRLNFDESEVCKQSILGLQAESLPESCYENALQSDALRRDVGQLVQVG